MSPGEPFPYQGPEALREPVLAALHEVLDPEVALSIVDVGLVYGLTVQADGALLQMTMTSAACPSTQVIVDDACMALDRVLPADLPLEVQLVWEPAWTPERMSARARAFMGW